MADILKITTPLTSRNHIPSANQPNGTEAPFELSNLSKVIKSQNESQMQGNNNGLIEKEGDQTLLANLLKDPAVTISYLKNIFLMQEVIKLLPVNNNSFTQEIRQLFDTLLVPPEQIVSEMVRQENASTTFKGRIFDVLRQVLRQNSSQEMKFAVANFLKALNGELTKESNLHAVANGLKFIGSELGSSAKIAEEINQIIQQIQGEQSKDDFPFIKQQVLEVLKEVEGSILFTPKADKIVSMIIYNLSRFRDNPTFLKETLDYLLTMMDGQAEKMELVSAFREFFENFKGHQAQRSQVMDALADIVNKQAFSRELTALHPDRVEKIIHSLLSSPCNFTPLLHFIVPVEFMDIRSFAEIWVDQNSYPEEEEVNGEKKENIHMLVVFEIEGVGQFEADLVSMDRRIDLTLLCPPAYTKTFEGLQKRLLEEMAQSPYQLNKITLGDFEKNQSLMEVFKNLPHKRTGLDVTI